MYTVGHKLMLRLEIAFELPTPEPHITWNNQINALLHMSYMAYEVHTNINTRTNQRTIGPENAHLKPDPGVLSHHEMTLTLNTHTPLMNS